MYWDWKQNPVVYYIAATEKIAIGDVDKSDVI